MSDNEFYRLWNEFGRKMNLVAILTLLSLVTGITGFVAIIFVIISLGNIKLIDAKVKSIYLYDFRKKMISSFVMKLISIFLLAGGIVGIVFSSLNWFNPGPFYPTMVINITLSSIITLIGLILFIVGFSTEMKAWENLKLYIAENRSFFPEHVASEAIDGAEKLRIAALMYALGFLGVTLIVGFILQIIGYFKLAKFNNVPILGYVNTPRIPIAHQLPKPPNTPIVHQAPELPYSSTETSDSKANRVFGIRPKFCHNCGAEIIEGGTFCPDCGSSIS